MILSSENKHFCNVGAKLYFVDLPSIFKEPACKKNKSFGGLAIFFWFFTPHSHGTFLCPKQEEEQHLGNFLRAVPKYRKKSSQLAHPSMQE